MEGLSRGDWISKHSSRGCGCLQEGFVRTVAWALPTRWAGQLWPEDELDANGEAVSAVTEL